VGGARAAHQKDFAIPVFVPLVGRSFEFEILFQGVFTIGLCRHERIVMHLVFTAKGPSRSERKSELSDSPLGFPNSASPQHRYCRNSTAKGLALSLSFVSLPFA
jgi:hypothetical protein